MLTLRDVRKEIQFCIKVGIPILGIIENMAMFSCPKCSHVSSIFPPTAGGAQAMAVQFDLPFLGSIPLDPRIGRSCDYGKY